MDVDPLVTEFANAMQEIYRRAKSEAGYNATVFLRMLQDRGALETAHYLIHTAKPSDGFTPLWQKGRLDLTVEAHVLQPRFEPLFTEEERTICSQRLEALGYTPPTTQACNPLGGWFVPPRKRSECCTSLRSLGWPKGPGPPLTRGHPPSTRWEQDRGPE